MQLPWLLIEIQTVANQATEVSPVPVPMWEPEEPDLASWDVNNWDWSVHGMPLQYSELPT
jgi:hypothetical protein